MSPMLLAQVVVKIRHTWKLPHVLMRAQTPDPATTTPSVTHCPTSHQYTLLINILILLTC